MRTIILQLPNYAIKDVQNEYQYKLVLILALFGFILLLVKWIGDRKDRAKSIKASQKQTAAIGDMSKSLNELLLLTKLQMNGSLSRLSIRSMELVYEWLYQRSSSKVAMHCVECIKDKDYRLPDVKKKLSDRLTNMFVSDLRDLQEFKYNGITLDKYLWKEGKDIIVEMCYDFIMRQEDSEVIHEKLWTEFIKHSNKTIEIAKNYKK